MKLRHLFWIQTVLSTINGITAILAPKIWLGLYGMTSVGTETAVVAQALGAALFNYGMIAFFARNSPPSLARKAIVIGFCLTYILGGLVVAIATLDGVFTALGWMAVFLYWIIAIGYAYFWLIDPES